MSVDADGAEAKCWEIFKKVLTKNCFFLFLV